MKPFARRFYKSAAWERCRQSYIASVFGLCERCGRPGRIVHHTILLTPANINDPTVTLNHEHLEYLCQDCHNSEHLSVSATADGLRFDENGNITANSGI